VYLARDPELDRKVAVKVLRGGGDPRADGEQRLRREALALAKLAHPNVVTVYEVGTDDFGSLLIAMEYVPARTLRTLLEEDELDLRANIQLHVGRWLRLAPCLSTGFRTRQDEAVITRNSADKI
jgi:serine/threonine protein kinase